MIAVDASSIAKLVLQEERWQEIEEYLKGNACSLDYAVMEAMNAIWKEHVLRKRITAEDASNKAEALSLISSYSLSIEPSSSYTKEGLRLAIKEKITVYDAVYIVQARKYGTLLTSDWKQAEISESLRINTICIK